MDINETTALIWIMSAYQDDHELEVTFNYGASNTWMAVVRKLNRQKCRSTIVGVTSGKTRSEALIELAKMIGKTS